MKETDVQTGTGLNPAKLVYRCFFYALGLLIMAFGVAISVNSELGVSTVNSLPYVISLIVKVDLGTCVIVVFACYILVQILLLRKRFRPIDLTQIVFSTLFGYFVDMAEWVVGDFALPTYFGRLVMLAMSIVMIALGVSMYVGTKLVNMPMEGMTSAITQLLPGKQFHQVKIVVDCLVVVVALLLSLLCLHGLYGVREGTVLCALLVGPMMKPIQKVLRPAMEKICF